MDLLKALIYGRNKQSDNIHLEIYTIITTMFYDRTICYYLFFITYVAVYNSEENWR